MKLFRTTHGIFVLKANGHYRLDIANWDELVARDNLCEHLESLTSKLTPTAWPEGTQELAPIGSQEVWAAGVTYYRSRDARMHESKDAGGGSFYDHVYAAERPELFFKATPHRVVGNGGTVAIRDDAKWSVPEPELVLYISPGGRIVGYTIGNDMSSRDIEGENPLYLPQAKVYDRSCSLGPCLLVPEKPLSPETPIEIEIVRRGHGTVFAGETSLKELKRKPEELASYLYRNNSFPHGCFLFTGTGIVPPDSFTLQRGDEIRIAIPPIGCLVNEVG